MKKLKVIRIFAAVCTAILLTVCLFACTSGDKPSSEGTTAAGSSAKETTAVTSKSFDKKITFTMNAIGAEGAGKDADGNPCKVYEWVKQKFNIDFEFIPVTWENYHTEMPQLWMASGDGPEIMMLDIAPARYPMFVQWVKNDLLKPYPEFGTKYPNLQKAWDKATSGKKFEIDGKIYAFPAFTDMAKYNYLGSKSWFYRADWAEAVGLRKADDVYTWDEWVALVKAVVEKDPGGNGPGKTLALGMDDWQFPRLLEGPRSVSPYLLTYTKKDGKWVWGPMLPESLEAIKMTRQLYDEGVIRQDQITGQVKQGPDFESGLAFAVNLQNSSPNINTRIANLKNVVKDLDPEKDLAYAMVKGVDGKFITEQGNDHWTQTALSINLSDEKLERWLTVLDYLVSDEGYNVRNYGIPGEDWEIKDGKLNLLWPKDENGVPQGPKGLAWANQWPWGGRAGNNDAADLDKPNNPEWARNRVKEILKTYMTQNVNIVPWNVELNYFSGPEYLKVGTLERDIYQKIAALMVSGNLEKEWKDWIDSQMPKIQPVLDELNAQLK